MPERVDVELREDADVLPLVVVEGLQIERAGRGVDDRERERRSDRTRSAITDTVAGVSGSTYRKHASSSSVAPISRRRSRASHRPISKSIRSTFRRWPSATPSRTSSIAIAYAASVFADSNCPEKTCRLPGYTSPTFPMLGSVAGRASSPARSIGSQLTSSPRRPARERRARARRVLPATRTGARRRRRSKRAARKADARYRRRDRRQAARRVRDHRRGTLQARASNARAPSRRSSSSATFTPPPGARRDARSRGRLRGVAGRLRRYVADDRATTRRDECDAAIGADANVSTLDTVRAVAARHAASRGSADHEVDAPHRRG